MIFKTFYLKKDFKLLFDKATQAIYAELFDFPELIKHLTNRSNNSELLKTYIVIQLITEKVIPIDKIDIQKAIDSFIKSEKNLLNNSESTLVLSYNEAKAEKGFLEFKEYFIYGEIAFKSNKYSYEGLKYKIEKIKKGPLTREEHHKFKSLANKILEAENKLKEHSDKSVFDATLEKTFNQIKNEIENDIKLNGKKTDVELDAEYEEIIKEFKKTIK